MRSILERGIGNASVDNVMKICKALEITVEMLESMANGEIENENKPSTVAAHLDGVDLTEKELNNYIDFLLSRKKK